MTNVTNNYSAPLGLPNGQTLAPGATASVAKWSDVKGHPVVKSWLDVGAISTDGSSDDGEKSVSGTAATSGNAGYQVREKGAGWFVVIQGDKEVTKSLRKDDVQGFDAKSDADKASFVETNKIAD